ncbi:MAG: hypothetical protein IT204_11370 [Fimbriimonadaceae bacterium]|nr:hypothetical protein [Fimbriimonadaceae bacterium]
MDAERFRREVARRFGDRLEHATYDNVREFVAWFNSDPAVTPVEDGRYVVDDPPAASLEETVRQFLWEMLAVPAPERARQHLWVAYLELWYAASEHEQSRALDRLFDQSDADSAT